MATTSIPADQLERLHQTLVDLAAYVIEAGQHELSAVDVERFLLDALVQLQALRS